MLMLMLILILILMLILILKLMLMLMLIIIIIIVYSQIYMKSENEIKIDYFIENATYGFLFTSCKTLENERVSAANE